MIFKIIDNGKGISEEQLLHIWNEQSGRQGVGLRNIAKCLLYFDNATINLESVENKGTTIIIKFPLIRNEGEVKTFAKRVLIDDEILALNLLEAMLVEIGDIHIVGKFLNASEGLENIEVLAPDILLLDIEMPDMNGIELAKKLEKISRKPEIVFVTAYGQYALEAFNVQAIDYILKPIEKERLKKTVQRIYQRRNEPVQYTSEPFLKAYFFGGFRLNDQQNKLIKWRTKKVKEPCAYLIYQNEPVHRDKIMEDLWPEHPQNKASALLHTSVYQLRKELKNHGFSKAIKYVDERYSLIIEIQSDVEEIKQILAKKHYNSKDIMLLLSLYKSDYLVEEDYNWTISEREHLRKNVINYLESFINGIRNEKKQEDSYKKAIEKLIQIDPWEERYTFELISLFLQQGNNKDALNTYDCYKEMLRKQLGTKPQKKIEKLIKTIR